MNTTDTNTAFAKTRAIVLSRASKAVKIERLMKEEHYEAQQAESIYNLIMSLERQKKASNNPYKFTMGVEIECFNLNRTTLLNTLNNRGIKAIDSGYSHRNYEDTYKLSNDSTINGRGNVELVSPILKDLKSLKTLCEVINEAGARVNRSCGLHIHLGASQMSGKDWRNILVNYGRIEHIIDSFMSESRRADNSSWCKSVVAGGRLAEFYADNCSKNDIAACTQSRYYKVNTHTRVHGHDTIEFRQHQGTTDFTKIENWIKFLTALVDWSMTHDEYITANSIDELPFLSAKQKKYYKERALEFARREGRA